jgi:hypothetical protein
MGLLAYILLFLGAFTILGLSLIFAPNESSTGYWLTVGWIEFLWVANWYTSTLIFGDKSKVKSGAGNLFGVMPSISFAVFIYSFVSAIAVFLYQADIIGFTLHALIQLLAFSVTGFIAIFSLLALKGATSGTETSASQNELIDVLSRLKRVAGKDQDALLILEEMHNYVLYHLPPPKSSNQERLKEVYYEMLKQVDGEVSVSSLKMISHSLYRI